MEQYTTEVRRKDRQEKDVSFLKRILEENLSCTISVERSGQPLLHTAFFAYNESTHSITFHFSKHGWAGKEMTGDKKATVSIYKTGKLYTAPKAVDFGCEYESVIIYGQLRIINDEAEKTHTLNLLFQKSFAHVPKDSYQHFTPNEAKQINVGSIHIDNWVGKAHYVPGFAIDSFYFHDESKLSKKHN
jgi:nitroimidazol reductase NimA-like FMN-containing flavoprotein (pyridoxamine 5'-phosphate oxidase superfamily)